MLTVNVTSNVSLPTEAANPVGVFRTCTHIDFEIALTAVDRAAGEATVSQAWVGPPDESQLVGDFDMRRMWRRPWRPADAVDARSAFGTRRSDAERMRRPPIMRLKKR
jgi:hypothetical protein